MSVEDGDFLGTESSVFVAYAERTARDGRDTEVFSSRRTLMVRDLGSLLVGAAGAAALVSTSRGINGVFSSWLVLRSRDNKLRRDVEAKPWVEHEETREALRSWFEEQAELRGACNVVVAMMSQLAIVGLSARGG